MKKLMLLFFLLVITITKTTAQTSDYCFQSKSDWNELNNIVCFDSQLEFSIGIFFAKQFNPNFKQPIGFVIGEEQTSKMRIDSSFVIQETKGRAKGIKRVSLNIGANLRLSFATLPFDELSGWDKAQVVIIAKTDGECQLVSNGSFKKQKEKTNGNTSLYSCEPIIKSINYNGENVELFIKMYYKNGVDLSYIDIGDTRIQL